MSDQCGKMRDLIDESHVAALPDETRAFIGRHLAECEACRAYADTLQRDEAALASLVRSHEASIARIERGVLTSLRSAVGERGRDRLPRRHFAMNRKVIFASAAVLATAAMIVLIGFAGGLWHGAAPAFADVLATIDRAKSVSYRQVMNIHGADRIVSMEKVNERGIIRSENENGSIWIRDNRHGLSLKYNSSAIRKAYLERTVGETAAASKFNWLDWYQGLYRKNAKLVGSEAMGGRMANLFVIDDGEHATAKIWADGKTNLPVRIEWIRRRDPNLDVPASITLGIPLSDYGGSPGEMRMLMLSGSWGMQDDFEVVCDEFEWNAALDDSLFSLDPPQGYSLEEYRFDVSDEGEKELVQALEIWTELSGGAFPRAIAELEKDEAVLPMLKKKYDRNGDPVKEWERALEDAHQLLKGLSFALEMQADGEWHYVAADATRGGESVPICWWKSAGNRYRLLRSDLSIVDVARPDLTTQGEGQGR